MITAEILVSFSRKKVAERIRIRPAYLTNYRELLNC